MFGKSIVFGVAPLLFGCGSSAALDPLFAGTWAGTTTYSITGVSGDSWPGTLVVAVSGSTAVANVCLDATGSLNATGSGDLATYSGNYVCAPTEVGNCTSLVVTYTTATATLTPGTPDHLTVVAKGTAVGCTRKDPITVNFVARRE
jgi:hypothetical protein